MRQGLFAMILVLAAFAGGALINGPGLLWVRQQLQGTGRGSAAGADALDAGENAHLGPGDIQIDIQDDPSTASDSVGKPGDTPPADSAPIEGEQKDKTPGLPVARQSPFDTGARRVATDRPWPPSASEPASEPEPGAAGPPSVRAPRGPSIALRSDVEPSDQAEPGAGSPSNATARSAPSAPLALAAGEADADRADPIQNPDHDEASQFPDAPDSAPAAAALPDPPAVPNPDGSPPTSSDRDARVRLVDTGDGGGNDPGSSAAPSDTGSDAFVGWEAVLRRMEELGVGRYWVEGDLESGSVRVRCVVPVVGDRAVSQHFEAEGDDVVSAAQDALRRIALWRATEAMPE